MMCASLCDICRRRTGERWRYVASQLDEAATGTLDTVEVEIALRLVLMLEGVKWRLLHRGPASGGVVLA